VKRTSDDDSQSLLGLLNIKRLEGMLVLILVILFLLAYTVIREITFIIITSILLGAWLVSRPSEWLATGVSNLGRHYHLSEYVIGVLASLTAILGEITVVVFSFWIAYTLQDFLFIELAILATLYSIGFNIMILGVTVVCKGGKKVAMPDDVLSKELEIIDWAMAACFLIAFLWLSKAFVATSLEGSVLYLPREVSFLLPVSYFVYTVNLRKIKYSGGKSYMTVPPISPRQSVFLVCIGTIMIIIGGGLLVDSAVILLIDNKELLRAYGDPFIITAVIIGGASAAYDTVINVIFASRGQILASVGNLLGSAIQLFMLVIGIVGIVILLPITQHIAFQLAVISMSFYFYRQALADKSLDRYEGAMLVLLQFFALVIAVRGFL